MTHANSIWRATANSVPALPKLDRDLKTDVVVVGAGFTGLAAAHHLYTSGVECVVIEANDIGWGASGRTGGNLVPQYKKGFAELARTFGTSQALRLHAMMREGFESIEEIISVYSLDCGFVRSGFISAAHTANALAKLQDDVRWLNREAGDTAPRMLDGNEVRDELGTNVYRGGYLDPRGGRIHPLDFVSGLAACLHERGVPIFVSTAATRISEEEGGAVVETPGGRVRGQKVLLATNAYTDLALRMGDLHRRIVPVSSSAIATKPLPQEVAATILPADRVGADTKHLLNYFRPLTRGRLLFGGRGDITGRRDDPGIYCGLERSLETMFPRLTPTEVDFRWAGMVAVTRDNFPHIGRFSERVLYAMGYGGRGIVLANLLGKYLALMVRGETVDAGPMSENPFLPFRFHGLRIPGMKAAVTYYWLRDMFGV